ncbi:MAG: hypothetical protein HY913_09490 [Desulfomonile tiedjei]|nr:hypothetical protein [Desulfomonile tiedjei]
MERRCSLTSLMIVAVFSTAMIAFLSYRPILGYFFTGTDTLTLIETSRIETAGDVYRIFSQPLMAGTRFVDVAKFYRPLASLSYSLDYFFWHLEPFGFQLTNLSLHILVSVLVVFLLRSLSRGDVAAAWIGGLIFATHPILVESVPAIDRRHDMLAAMFLIMSLLAFVRCRRRREWGGFFLILSIVSYVLALAAKETAIILPFVLFLYSLIFHDGSHSGRRFPDAARGVAGFVAVTLAYLAWRIHVLGGIGGYQGEASISTGQFLLCLANIVHSYFQDLLYPADFLGIIDSQAGYGLTVLLISAFIAYSMVLFWQAGQKGAAEACFSPRKLLLFLLGWLAFPLILFGLTLTFAHRSMYLAAVPFSGVLALAIVWSFRQLRSSLANTQSKFKFRHALCVCPRLGALVLGVAISGSLVAHSPLVHPYKAWEDSAKISSLVLKKLADAAPELPRNCAIHMYDVPDRIQSYRAKIPHSKEVAFLQDYSIKSWLDLNVPDNALRIIIHSRSWPSNFTGSLNLTTRVLSHNSVWARVTLGQTRYSRLRRSNYYR